GIRHSDLVTLVDLLVAGRGRLVAREKADEERMRILLITPLLVPGFELLLRPFRGRHEAKRVRVDSRKIRSREEAQGRMRAVEVDMADRLHPGAQRQRQIELAPLELRE